MTVMHNMEDADLVLNYIRGEEKCLNLLIERHQTRVFGFIYHKVLDYDLANDLFQETFIKVINSLKQGKYNEEGKFLPWVLTIANNVVLDNFRIASKKKKLELHQEDDEHFKDVSETVLSFEDMLIRQELLLKIENFIDQLPIEQQQVLKMRIYMDLSFKEIAEETSVSVNTALGRMRYAILALRKLIEKHEIFSNI